MHSAKKLSGRQARKGPEATSASCMNTWLAYTKMRVESPFSLPIFSKAEQKASKHDTYTGSNRFRNRRSQQTVLCQSYALVSSGRDSYRSFYGLIFPESSEKDALIQARIASRKRASLPTWASWFYWNIKPSKARNKIAQCASFHEKMLSPSQQSLAIASKFASKSRERNENHVY